MADQNSSLPVRTEAAGDIIAKIADAVTPSQQLAIDASGRITTKMQDGAGNAVTSQANSGQRALDVGINVAGVQVDPRAIRALTSADIVTAAQGAPNTIGNAWPVKPTDGTNSQGYTASSEAKVSVTQPIPAGTNSIGKVGILDATLNPFSNVNPLPVSVVGGGTPIDSYNTASAIASGATSNHDYTVTALKTFTLKNIFASSSGRMKIEVQLETAAGSGTFGTIFVAFSSTSNTNIEIPVLSQHTQVAGAKIRIIRTQRDLLAADVYSTISGSEA